MTENFHTPIPVAPAKPSADSETFNGPLSELDSAITTQQTTITEHEGRLDSVEAEMPVPSGNPSEYLNGEGNWTVPAGTGDVNGHAIQDEGAALPQRANLNFVGAGVVVTDESGGTQVAIPGASGIVESIVAGANVTVDDTDPANPIVSASGVQVVFAGNNVSVDNTDPENPIVSASAVQAIVAGTGISVDNTDPENPVISVVGGGGADANAVTSLIMAFG